MEKSNYLHGLSEYFYNCRVSDFDEETLHQVRRCLLDHIGCSVFPAGYGMCESLVQQIMALVPQSPENAAVWGEANRTSAWAAAFANAVRTSNIELDDCSGIGASVHPGVYIWSSILKFTTGTEPISSAGLYSATTFACVLGCLPRRRCATSGYMVLASSVLLGWPVLPLCCWD